MSIQKQGAEEHKVATKEKHRKQYRAIARILIIDDESDITLAFRKAISKKRRKEQRRKEIKSFKEVKDVFKLLGKRNRNPEIIASHSIKIASTWFECILYA